MYRVGESSLHRGPDGLNRNAEGRDLLILARDSEWTGYRVRISVFGNRLFEVRAMTKLRKH